MKKLLVTILALLYITSSTGAVVTAHYCMGKLTDWRFGHSPSNNCGKCGMEKSDGKDNGCCKDEQKFLKNDSGQKTSENVFQMNLVLALGLPSSFFEISVAGFPSVTEENPVSNAPPRNTAVAFYILNRTFLI